MSAPARRSAPIDVVELTEDRPELLDDLAAVRAETDADINPDDPPTPVAELAAELFAQRDDRWFASWLAYVDGEPAGELQLGIDLDDQNRHIAEGEWLAVRPRFRRRGVADALLGAGLERVAGMGCSSLLLWVPMLADGAGSAYAGRLGLTSRIAERCSRLRLDDLDRGLVEKWAEQGRDRSDGYRLVQFVGRIPEEHLEALAHAHRAMEDMPTDAMEWTIPPMTPAKLRAREDAWERAGRSAVTSLVLAPDGSGAGLSELNLNRHRPMLANQGDTGVRQEHRGRGLGRWLKAENLFQALAAEPAISVIETYNAQSNPWMLDINVAMGFRPHVVYEGFQGDLDAARRTIG